MAAFFAGDCMTTVRNGARFNGWRHPAATASDALRGLKPKPPVRRARIPTVASEADHRANLPAAVGARGGPRDGTRPSVLPTTMAGCYVVDVARGPEGFVATALHPVDRAPVGPLGPGVVARVILTIEPYRLDLARAAFVCAHGRVNEILAGGVIRNARNKIGTGRARARDPRGDP